MTAYFDTVVTLYLKFKNVIMKLSVYLQICRLFHMLPSYIDVICNSIYVEYKTRQETVYFTA